VPDARRISSAWENSKPRSAIAGGGCRVALLAGHDIHSFLMALRVIEAQAS
jgi:hypothetical protein